MTLTELRYILAVARERHFGRAAESCLVSQPTLSVAVRKLEYELGVTLFERATNEVTVTPAGARVVEQAQRVLEEVETLKQIAHQGQDQLVGPLRLGLIHTIGPYLLPHVVPLLHEMAPQMPLILVEDSTANLVERLKRGEVDVVVVSLPFGQSGIKSLALYDEPFVVVLPVPHPWAEKAAIEVQDLAREDLLMLGEGHCFRDQVLKLCPDCGYPSNKSLTEAGSLETIRYMVASGLGITVLPCTAAAVDRYSEQFLTIRRFVGTEPTRRVGLAWRRSFARSEAIDLIRRVVLASPLNCVRMLETDTLLT